MRVQTTAAPQSPFPGLGLLTQLLRPLLLLKATGILALLCVAIFSVDQTPAPLVYAVIVICGSWIFPLITFYIPHIAEGQTPLTQTRLFRILPNSVFGPCPLRLRHSCLAGKKHRTDLNPDDNPLAAR